MDQRTPEWFVARCGRITASRVSDVVARTKTGWGASRANYMAELIAERLTGDCAASFTNAAMQWGTDTEPMALAAYGFHADAEVIPEGFVIHPQIPMSGASPDGLVGLEGLVEVKCPNTATHIETLIGQQIPSKYETQMLWQMSCTGRKWCDFVSFDPRLPDEMRLFVKRIWRDDERVAFLEAEVAAFDVEVDAKIRALREAIKPEARRAA